MSLHTDLLKQARHLARKEPKRPSQASLRRAVSASYYALFHLLIGEATQLMLSGRRRRPLRQSLARAFAHSTMKRVAQQFANQSVSDKLIHGFNDEALDSDLVDFADAFVELQQARHEADYALHRRFTRSEVVELIDRVDTAFQNWTQIRGSLQADTFLVGLLAFNLMQG